LNAPAAFLEVLAEKLLVISPEGSILSKLDWARRGGSDRQLRDAASVLAANRETLNFDYLRGQARELGVEDLLEKILALT
jgi:hypothetical protein